MTASLSEILREETLRKAKCSDRVSRCRLLVLSLYLSPRRLVFEERMESSKRYGEIPKFL